MSQKTVSILRPAFIVGVTGNVDPDQSVLNPDDPTHNIHETVSRVLKFLKHGAGAQGGKLYDQIKASLPNPDCDCGLGQWPGLPHTPIVVLSSLAPGADTIVAHAALDLGFPVRGFLPFDLSLYPDASTFVENRLNPTEEEIKKQRDFHAVVERVKEQNIYAVVMEKDLSLEGEALLDRMRSDRDATEKDMHDRQPRSYRYQAAGQYIGAHCDLLLALWDDEADTGKPEGTGGTVEAKLRGVTPGLLPSANAFNWADTGPVLHLYMRRTKNNKPPRDPKLGTLRVLHSNDFPRNLVGATPVTRGPVFQETLAKLWKMRPVRRSDPDYRPWAAYRDWQTAGNLFLCRLARNLDAFNASYREPVEPERPLCLMLDPKLKGQKLDPLPDDSRSHQLFSGSPETFDALASLTAARRHAADASAELRDQSIRTLRTIFGLVFIFAVCAHLCAHWEIGHESVHSSSESTAHEQRTEAAVPASGAHSPVVAGVASASAAKSTGGMSSPLFLRYIFGLSSLLAGGLSLWIFWRHRARRVEERDQDYRALSEGLRVQIAWCLAGLPHSAAGHYMERQRNELEWIRSAMSSLAMPHRRWERWFSHARDDSSAAAEVPTGDPTVAPANFSTSLRMKRLRWVEALWVDEQAAYHSRRFKELSHDMHFFHKSGSVLALSGLLQATAWVWEIGAGWLGAKETMVKAEIVQSVGLGVFVLTLVSLTIMWVLKTVRAFHKNVPLGQAASKAFWSSCLEMAGILIPARHGSHLDAPRGKRWRMFVAFVGHLPLAIGLAALVTAMCITVHKAPSGFLPSPSHLITITSGILLVAGGLGVAWAEKNLLSEQAYQYSAMASLFNSAKTRLHDALDDLETEKDPKEVEKRLKYIREMLYDLGVEALGENAEWLILHRARPMEPMMAG